jgi:hypothetical protein
MMDLPTPDGLELGPITYFVGADLDGDGDLDLYDRTNILRNDGSGRFAFEPIEIDLNGLPLSKHADGVVLARSGEGLELWSRGRTPSGHGFVVHAKRNAGAPWGDIHVTYADDDELVQAYSTPGSVGILGGVRGAPLLLGDVDGDGVADVVFPGSQAMTVLIGTPSGRLGSPLLLGIERRDVNGCGRADLFDVDGDGLDDLIFTDGFSPKIWVVRNTSE